MTTRRGAVALALVALVATSGCIGFLTGSESLTFESSQVSVSDEAAQSADYEKQRQTTTTINRTFSAAGQSRNVTVTNHLTEYSRTVSLPLFDDQELARFTVFSTPQVNILEQTFNPVGDMSNRELALMLQEEYETIENVEHVENRSATVLGKNTTVGKFRADARTVGGTSTEVYVHITKVEDGDDFVVAVAVHPTQVEEQEKVDTMLQGIQHG